MNESFGKQIKQLRELTGMSAHQLAEKLGVTASTVRRWEAGTIKVSGGRRLEIERLLSAATPKPRATPGKKPLREDIIIIVDRSSSMRGIWPTIQRMHAKLVEDFRTSASALGRVIDLTTITFADDVSTPTMVRNIQRMSSDELHDRHNILAGHCYGWTALWDAVGRGIETADEHGEHESFETSHLIIVLTDGEENRSKRFDIAEIKCMMSTRTATDIWTFTFQVPPGSKRQFCRNTDVPEGNVVEWEATEKGARSTFVATSSAANHYLSMRSQGLRSSRSFYTTDMASVSKSDVKSALRAMTDVSGACKVLTSTTDSEIRPFIESRGFDYKRGAAFYQLVKRESAVQDYKKLIITEIGKPGIFCGTSEARRLLGLPQTGTVKIVPGDHAGFEIFVQSTSVNRKLPAGTKVVYYPGAAS